MQKTSLGTIRETRKKRGDETARIIAEIFECDESYVRKLINGTRVPKRPKAKAQAKMIITAYWNWKNKKESFKNNLIKAVEKAIAV